MGSTPPRVSPTIVVGLRIIRRLAIAGVVLSVLALPLGLIALLSGLSTEIGDNGIGDVFALAIGISFVVVGVGGLLLGTVLAALARRVAVDPVDIRGFRRLVLIGGLIVAGVQVLIAAALGGGWLPSASVIAAFAAGFLVVASASRGRGISVLAGVLSAALLVLGVVPLWGQASQKTAGASRTERVALLPPDWPTALAAAAAAAPEGWAVPTLLARITDYSPSQEGVVLPTTLVGQSLRGILVVDCAGADRLDVVARDPDAPGEDAPIALGTVTCEPEPSVLLIEIPDVLVQTNPSGSYVLGIAFDPVNEGAAGGMNRAALLVAATGTPDPERDALVATFAAAFGNELTR